MKISGVYVWLILFATLFVCGDCSNKTDDTPPPVLPTPSNDMDLWLTKANQSVLLQKQNDVLSFGTTANGYPNVDVDSATTYQSIDGFGYTLTGGSAFLINNMPAGSKAGLLNELFGTGNSSIGVSFLRISIGASDLSQFVFSYNDMPAGQTDPTLVNFSLSKDTVDLIPLLQQILAINPAIKIMGSPWSAPAWMKDNGSSVGGSLQPQYYGVYATYLVKYVQQMQAKGIPIHSITIQNEPENGGNNPSMLMTATQQATFIKNHLGPAFQAAGITTKIIVFDHNCDNPNYPISILNDAAAKPFVDGSAFHLYSGNISAMSNVNAAHPDRNLYFTEQWTSSAGSFSGDLAWHLRNVIVGSTRNWSRVALEWNLANDPSFGPHTPGGCTQCKGALTINGSAVNRNVSYYIIGHAAKFVPAGSVRIASSLVANLPNVAFKTPAGKKVLIVLNDNTTASGFNIRYKGRWVAASLDAGAVGTYVW
ncbi:MAG: glucosylceramidase [Chitinophagales bacterium]|nr:glucosylceramidase [Chitinophagales bacterium]